MPQQPPNVHARQAGRARALHLLLLLAVGLSLAGCGRCGDLWPWSQSQIGACQKDSPRP